MAGYVGKNTLQYTPVEYIESSGTQSINTGFYANNNTRVVAKVVTGDISSGGSWQCLFSSKTSYHNNEYVTQVHKDNSKWYSAYGNADSQTISVASNTEYTIDKNKNVFNVNGTTVTQAENTFTATQPMYIFSDYESGLTNYFRGKLYYLKIYDNGTLVRDFVPIKDGNNVACLYDLVEAKYYYNVGTGTFTAGSETGQTVYADVARKIKNAYVGVSDVARKIKKGYVGDSNGVARLCFGHGIPTYKTTVTGNANQKVQPNVAATPSYVLIAGGSQSGGIPVNITTAYNTSGVATSAANLPTISKDGGATNFNEYAIIMGGKTASGGSARTNQCIAYTDNLTNRTLSNLYDNVFAVSSAATSEHFIAAGGSNYSQWLTSACAYNKSFTKTTLSNMSIYRGLNALASVDQYIVCCGGNGTSYGNVDFYDNSNVKTTSSNPYGNKQSDGPLGLSTNSYAIFFGGRHSGTAFTDCQAYNKNKVLTQFSAPIAIARAQGFSNGDYACVFYNSNELIYNDNLVLVDNISGGSWSNCEGKVANANEKFGLIVPDWSANVYLFNV